MNLFKSIIKWCGVIVYAGFLATVAYAATMPEPIKLYVIYTYKFNERVIEKIYIKKENAQKYCDMYKEHHNYTFEELTISE
jgi:hypothetical protein